MAIDSTTVLTKLKLRCRCGQGTISSSDLYNGDTQVAVINPPYDPADPTVAELVSRIKAGTLPLPTYEDIDSGAVIAYDDFPQHLWGIERLHPFHKDDRHLASASFVHHSDYAQDAATGHPTVTYDGTLAPGNVTPSGAFDQELSGFYAISTGANTFRVILEIDESENVPKGAADNYPPIKAFLARLEQWRTVGPAVGTLGSNDGYQSAIGSTGGQVRNFGIPQTTGQNVQVAFFGSGIIYSDDDTKILLISVDFIELAASDPHSAPLLNTLFATTSQSIPSQAGAIKGAIGAVDKPVLHRKLVGPGGVETEWINGVQVHKGTLNGDAYAVLAGPSRGLIVPYDRLPASPSPRRYPVHPLVREVHFGADETAAGDIQVPIPRDLLKYSLGVMYGSLHNRNASHPVTFRDFNGGELMSLGYDENLEFKVSFDGHGNGELLGVTVPERLQIFTTAEFGTLSTPPYYLVGSTLYGRLAPVPSDDAFFLDMAADVFTVGTATATSGSAWNATNAAASRETLTCDRGGELHFIQTVDVEVQGEGSLPHDHYLQLFLKRGNTLTPWGVSYQQEPLTGINTSRTLRWENLGLVQASDVIFPMIIFPTTSTLSTNDIDIIGTHRSARLKPSINVAYAA